MEKEDLGNKKAKWIITMDIEYYPWIEYYETYEEAKKEYDWYLKSYDNDETITLSKIKLIEKRHT